MTKQQEEIREGIALIIMDSWDKSHKSQDTAYDIMAYLASQNVVLKVERELSEGILGEINEVAERWALRPNYAEELIGKILTKAGFAATESLIEEEK